MKKRLIYFIPLAVFFVAAGFIVSNYKKKDQIRSSAFYPLLDRKGAQTEEWKDALKRFDEAIKIMRTNPDDIRSRIDLASLYIKEARVTGNYTYYDQAAMKYVNEVLEKDPRNFEGLVFKSLIYLSQHHFADGLALAEKAKELNPHNAFVYGILVDGYVEMGRYAEAIAAADRMISIRPDIRSYSRISYLREIHGDYPGAIEAMKMAVEAGLPGDEATEWARVQLGHLYEQTGDWKSAEMHYLISLQHRPMYPYAIAGRARIATANKNYENAIQLYVQADSLVHDYSFKEQLAHIYKATGQTAKATELSNWLINEMTKHADTEIHDDNIGHYADRELAYAYLEAGKYDKALRHAKAEYARRPDNIDANETLAWVYYNKGDFAKAQQHIEIALKTKSANPILIARAGLIYAKGGDIAKARGFLKLSNDSKAYLPVRDEVKRALQGL